METNPETNHKVGSQPDMRILLLLACSLPLAAGPIIGGPCDTGTIAEYVALGSTGCTFSASGVHLSDVSLTDSSFIYPPDPNAVTWTVTADTATHATLSLGGPFAETGGAWFSWDLAYLATIPADWTVTAAINIASADPTNGFVATFHSATAVPWVGQISGSDLTGPLSQVIGTTSAGDPGNGVFLTATSWTSALYGDITVDSVTLDFAAPSSPVGAPEPSTCAIGGLGMLALIGLRRRARPSRESSRPE